MEIPLVSKRASVLLCLMLIYALWMSLRKSEKYNSNPNGSIFAGLQSILCRFPHSYLFQFFVNIKQQRTSNSFSLLHTHAYTHTHTHSVAFYWWKIRCICIIILYVSIHIRTPSQFLLPEPFIDDFWILSPNRKSFSWNRCCCCFLLLALFCIHGQSTHWNRSKKQHFECISHPLIVPIVVPIWLSFQLSCIQKCFWLLWLYWTKPSLLRWRFGCSEKDVRKSHLSQSLQKFWYSIIFNFFFLHFFSSSLFAPFCYFGFVFCVCFILFHDFILVCVCVCVRCLFVCFLILIGLKTIENSRKRILYYESLIEFLPDSSNPATKWWVYGDYGHKEIYTYK